MTDIDPRDFGRLESEVAALRRDFEDRGRIIDRMAQQLDELTTLANKGRGGFWAGMLFVSFISSVVGFFMNHWVK